MSARGYVVVDRGVWNHELFLNEPFSRRDAWLWLISEATWKPKKSLFIDGKHLQLTRGQLAFSLRALADKWQWSKSTVARFLSQLKSEAMIDQNLGHGLTVITISNYDKYQKNDDSGGTNLGQARDKLGTPTKNLNTETGKTKNSPRPARGHPDQKPMLLPIDGGQKTKRPHTLPRDFFLTPERIEVAVGCGLEPAATFKKFCEWFWMSGKQFANWDTRWTMWCSDQIAKAHAPVAAAGGRTADPTYGTDHW